MTLQLGRQSDSFDLAEGRVVGQNARTSGGRPTCSFLRTMPPREMCRGPRKPLSVPNHDLIQKSVICAKKCFHCHYNPYTSFIERVERRSCSAQKIKRLYRRPAFELPKCSSNRSSELIFGHELAGAPSYGSGNTIDNLQPSLP